MSATKKNVDVSKLLDAARGGNIRDAVDLIKNKGLDVDTTSRLMETPLILSAHHGHMEMVKALIAMGAESTKADKFGKTALIHASTNGHEEIVNFLVQCGGGELTSQCKYGFSAKDWADHSGHKNISQSLAKAESDVAAGKGPKRLSSGRDVLSHTRKPDADTGALPRVSSHRTLSTHNSEASLAAAKLSAKIAEAAAEVPVVSQKSVAEPFSPLAAPEQHEQAYVKNETVYSSPADRRASHDSEFENQTAEVIVQEEEQVEPEAEVSVEQVFVEEVGEEGAAEAEPEVVQNTEENPVEEEAEDDLFIEEEVGEVLEDQAPEAAVEVEAEAEEVVVEEEEEEEQEQEQEETGEEVNEGTDAPEETAQEVDEEQEELDQEQVAEEGEEEEEEQFIEQEEAWEEDGEQEQEQEQEEESPEQEHFENVPEEPEATEEEDQGEAVEAQESSEMEQSAEQVDEAEDRVEESVEEDHQDEMLEEHAPVPVEVAPAPATPVSASVPSRLTRQPTLETLRVQFNEAAVTTPKHAYLSATTRTESTPDVKTVIVDEDIPAPGSVRAKILEMEDRSKSFRESTSPVAASRSERSITLAPAPVVAPVVAPAPMEEPAAVVEIAVEETVAVEDGEDEHKAATLMQRIARGKTARKEMLAKKEAAAAASAAVQVVAIEEEPAHIVEVEAAPVVDEHAEHRAATQMQKLQRGKAARKEVHAKRQAAKAVVVVEPVVEAASASVVVEEEADTEAEHKAATHMQKLQRGKAARKEVHAKRQAAKAIVVVEPVAEVAPAVEAPVAPVEEADTEAENKAATHMQKLQRAKAARKEVQIRREARHASAAPTPASEPAEVHATVVETVEIAPAVTHHHAHAPMEQYTEVHHEPVAETSVEEAVVVEDGEDEHKAATLMQRIARGKTARKEMLAKKEAAAAASAAVQVEVVVVEEPAPAPVAAVEVAEEKDVEAEHRAATHMQKITRGKMARKEAAARAAQKATAVETVVVVETKVQEKHVRIRSASEDSVETVVTLRSNDDLAPTGVAEGDDASTVVEEEAQESEGEANIAALIWAAFQGETEQVRALLCKVTDINAVDEHGMSALHFAANAGHLEIVQMLLTAGADVNAVVENGSTPFHWAAANSHLDVVQALRAGHANIDAPDQSGLTALLWAADMGHIEVVELLLADGADLHAVDENGLNALLWAADRGHLDCVEALLRSAIDINVVDKNGYTALHRAANGGFLEVVKLLVEANADLRRLDKNEMTALDWAEENEHVAVAEYLSHIMNPTATAASTVLPFPAFDARAELEREEGEEEEVKHEASEAVHEEEAKGDSNAFAEANPIDEAHMTALIWAAHHGELQKVRELLHKHSDVNFADEHGMSALHYAANAGHLGIVELLLAADAELNAVDEHGSTPFHWAASNCHLEVVRALLAAHADINAADQHGMTALLWAADMGHLQVLELLLHSGADMTLVDDNGLTALLWAADRGHVDCVKALLDAGIDVNIVDKNSYTALHRASNAGNLEIVQTLVAGQADVFLLDKNGMTALEWAISQEHYHVADFLRRYSTLASASKDSTPKVVEPVTPAPIEHDDDSVSTTLSVSAPSSAHVLVPREVHTATLESKSGDAFGFGSAADLHSLRRSLEFDASTVQFKENILCERYYVLPGFPLHVSSTSVLVHAVDFGLQLDYEEVYRNYCKKTPVADSVSPRNSKMSSSTFAACLEALKVPSAPLVLPSFKKNLASTTAGELFAKYAKESKSGIYISQTEFVQLCRDLIGDTRRVVIKFMKEEGPFRWEFAIRKLGRLDPECVVGTITAVPEAELALCVQELILTDPAGTARAMKNYPFALIMPAADRSLDSVIRQERPCTSFSRLIMQQVATAVQHIHQRGVMHGDLYALNVARLDGRMVLLDMDSAVEFGDAGSATSGNFSSGVFPPEMFAILDQEQQEVYGNYWAEDRDKKTPLWEKIKPVMTRDGKGIVVRTVHPSRSDGSGLPYELVGASDTIDVWSFGLLFFCTMNPTGNGLFQVSQDGDLVRTADNFLGAASWSDDQLADAILHNIPDMLAADLLLKVLRRDPNERLDIVQILAHPFFTDPSAKNREARAATHNVLKLRERMQRMDRQQEAIGRCTDRVFDLSDPAYLQIKKTDTILLRSVFDNSQLIVPTCFILLNQHIVPVEQARPGQITTANWLSNISDLSNFDDDLYLYLLDEFTMQPILHFTPKVTKLSPRGSQPASKMEYPFRIQNPAEFVPAVLPLLLLSMKATALLHGTSSLMNSLGHPKPPVALDQAVAWAGSLDLMDSLLEFSNLQDSAEEATRHLTGANNTSPEAVKLRAQYVRDAALKELCALYAEHYILYDAPGETTFCGLRRVTIPGGFVCWTQADGVANIRSGLAANTHLRLKESVA